jgi:hypothetical protein
VAWKFSGEVRSEASWPETPSNLFQADASPIAPEPSPGRSTNHLADRRSTVRFPLEMQAEVSAGDLRFSGKTANISSGGLLVSCDSQVEVSTLVTVRLDWPIQQRKKPVFLIVHGEIIRRDSNCLAIIRRRHEFEVGPAPTQTNGWISSLLRARVLFRPLLTLPQLDLATWLTTKPAWK